MSAGLRLPPAGSLTASCSTVWSHASAQRLGFPRPPPRQFLKHIHCLPQFPSQRRFDVIHSGVDLGHGLIDLSRQHFPLLSQLCLQGPANGIHGHPPPHHGMQLGLFWVVIPRLESDQAAPAGPAVG